MSIRGTTSESGYATLLFLTRPFICMSTVVVSNISASVYDSTTLVYCTGVSLCVLII